MKGLAMKTAKLLLFALFAATVVYAEDEIRLPRIDVIGEVEEEYQYIPGAFEIISPEILTQSRPLSTQDALKRVAGVNVVETDGFGFYPRIGIRGLNPDMSRKVLLLEDGAPVQLGPFIDPAAYYSPPVERMERLEVLKGSSSLRYGPSTIGGAVNYITRKPQPRRHGMVALKGGNAGYGSILAEYGDKWGDFLGSVSFLHKQGDGWRDMPFTVNDLVLKGSVSAGSAHHFSVKGTFYDQVSHHTYLGLTQREFEEDCQLNRAENDRMYVRRLSLDLNHEYDISEDILIRTLAYWNKAERNWWREDFAFASDQAIDGYGDTIEAGYNYMRNSVGGRLREFNVMGIDSRLEYNYRFGDVANKLEIGLRPHYEFMTNNRINSSDSAMARSGDLAEDDSRYTAALAFFAQNRFRMVNHSLTPGLRVEYYNQKREVRRMSNDSVNVTTSASNTVLIPGVGYSWRINPSINLFAGVHRGFAPPRVQDAIDGQGQAVKLDAENSINYELGLRGRIGPARYEVTGFRYDFDNQVINASEAGGASAATHTNAGETVNQGMEMTLSAELLNSVELSTNWTWVPVAEFRNDLFDSNDRQVRFKGNRLPYAPEHLVNARVGYRLGPVTTGVSYSYTGKQYTDEANTEIGSARGREGAIPSYSLWNMDVQYRINRMFELNGTVKNIFDHKYISSRAPRGIFPGAGRMVHLGGSFSF
ncbi:TonB-dependent receptor [Chitinispirillum alkaliphilum]|nr:TonB-dependent receptor [Chitinispirillum alkaliphilum]